jgi:hypothetical protein
MPQMNALSRLALVVAVAVAVVSPGCGYSLAGRGSFLPAYIRVVGIPPLENRTPILRIEQLMTEKIRAEFINRGKYEIVPISSGADAVVSGAIIGIATQPVGLTAQQQASRYLITVTMRVLFSDSRNGQVLWSNEALTFREEYDLKTRSNGQLDSAVLLEQEGPAMERLSTDLARSVVSSILEAF